jgi:two-component system phosphate regulon sensor histidine kinase PhoR
MSRKPTLLIVEDEEAIQKGLTDLFIFNGYDVVACGDGEDLVDNAIKFSSTEGQVYDKKIDINFCESDAYIIMSVRDYGPGLTPAQSKRVFELFYRAGSELTRTTTGTGIGLNLVAELAKDMGGYAKCNVKDPGLEIQVYFPSSN